MGFLSICLGSPPSIEPAPPGGSPQRLQAPAPAQMTMESAESDPTPMPDAAKRATTLRQLREVARQIQERCEKEGWEGMRFVDGKMTPTKIMPDTVNVYDVVECIIKPACTEAKCSYVELIGAGTEQPPVWVVSFWPGHPMLDLIAALETHASDHTLSDAAAYWLEPFANNLIEHQPADGFAWSEFGKLEGGKWESFSTEMDDLGASVYAKAVALAEGRVVTVVDGGGMVFKRSTCTFELFLGLQGVHEIYVALKHMRDGKPRSAVGITFGPAINSSGNEEDANQKLQRERYFPLALAKAAFGVSLECGQSNSETFRVASLNAIVGQAGLKAPPPETHDNYDKLNALLRGRFAVVALPLLLMTGESIKQALYLVKGCGLKKMQLSFSDIESFDAEVMRLIAAFLPPDLEELDMTNGGLKPEHALALAESLKAHTRLVKMNLGSNQIGKEAEQALRDTMKGRDGFELIA